MSCSSDLLPFEFPVHAWHTEVTGTRYLADQATNMWGRLVQGEHVVCHKREVCERCGVTKHERDCICDVDVGEACLIRLEYLEQTGHR